MENDFIQFLRKLRTIMQLMLIIGELWSCSLISKTSTVNTYRTRSMPTQIALRFGQKVRVGVLSNITQFLESTPTTFWLYYWLSPSPTAQRKEACKQAKTKLKLCMQRLNHKHSNNSIEPRPTKVCKQAKAKLKVLNILNC